MTQDRKRAVVIDKKKLIPPFNLTLKGDDEPLECTCTDIIRLVPGKRAVLLGRWRGKTVVVKLFYKRFRAAKHLKMEVEGHRLLKKANIATAGILHWGSVMEYRSKVLIFDYIHPSKNLGATLKESRDKELCREYLEKLMILLARMHEAGLQHNDLHLDNFLVKDNELYALDGAALYEKHRDAPLDRGASLKNLATLFAQQNLGDKVLFMELASVYYAARKFDNRDKQLSLLKQLVKEARKFRTDRYLKKIYRESTETVCIKSFTSFLLCKRKNYTPAMASFLQNPDIAFEGSGSTMLKRGNSATVVRFKVDDCDLVVKRYNVKDYIHALKRAFQKSRADRSWYGAHLLLEYGIRTPKPIAMKEIRLGLFRNRAYLICDYIGGISAQDYFKDPLPKGESDLSQKVLRIFERLESLQVSHGDMKATNIIIHDGNPFLIDLDSMAVHKSKALFARARSKDIKRFMKNWTEKPEIATLFHLLK